MFEEQKANAAFLTIYIREAHPTDEWKMDANEKGKDDVCYLQPRTLEDRLAIAKDFTARFHYPLPLAVDTMSDAADERYGAWPERLYVITADGRVAYRGGMGPFDYHPEEVRAWLEKHTAEGQLKGLR